MSFSAEQLFVISLQVHRSLNWVRKQQQVLGQKDVTIPSEAEGTRGGRMEDQPAAGETALVEEESNVTKEAAASAIGGNAEQHSEVN